MTVEGFATECRETSRNMRRLPAEVRRELRTRVKAEVAEPMAADIRAAGRGPYGARLATAVKIRAQADPTVVIGGAKRLVSGGASGRDLVFGTEFGGGKRLTAVPRSAAHRGYRRYSTNQFRKARPFVFPTIGRNVDRYLGLWADVVEDVIAKEVGRG